MSGPLSGLRVLERATGVAGPYAGRLLTMLGADVVKVEPLDGDCARTLSVDGGPEKDPSAVFVHLNAGKRIVRRAPRPEWADIVIDDHLRGAFPEVGDALLVSITAWGVDHDDAGDPYDELRVQAASGMLAVNGDDGCEPVRFPGWQSQYLAGAYAAAAALAGLANGARHVEVTWVDAASTGVEGAAATALHRAFGEEENARAAGLQAAAFPSGTFACMDGFVIPGTVRPIDWKLQCEVYERPDLLTDPRFDWKGRWVNRDALRAELDPWYRSHTKHEIFSRALVCGWAVGMVMTARDALEDEHLAARRFLGRCGDAMIASRPWRADGIREGHDIDPPAVVDTIDDAIDDVAPEAPEAAITATAATAPAEPVTRPAPLQGLKVLELTWAWAGPFVGRFLAGFGADVVRIETGARPDGWRTALEVNGEMTWDAAPLHNSLNRSKRSASIDLTHPDGHAAFVALLATADVFVVNMSASVLADRGIEEHVRRAVENGLVAMTLPSLGNTGPYRDMPGYGMLIEGMGGLAARFGRPEEGARASSTYYPDAVAGVHGAVAILAGLAQHHATGRGTFIDLSQQEVMWLQLGEGLVLASRDGREPERRGNAEAGCRPPDGVTTWSTLETGGPDMVESIDHPVTGRRRYLGSPVRVDGERVTTTRAPRFGEHTDAVLAGWLGWDGDRIGQLRADGAIGSVPRPRHRR